MNYLTKIKRGELSKDGERRFASCLLLYLMKERQKLNDVTRQVCQNRGINSCRIARDEADKQSLTNFDKCLDSSNWDGGKYLR